MDRHPGDVLAREDDLSVVGLDEARHHAQQRALAAPRGPQEREELARRGVERHAVDRDHRAERLAEPADAERRRGAAHRRGRARRPPRDQRAISRPQRSDHSGNFFATRSVSGKNMRCTSGP